MFRSQKQLIDKPSTWDENISVLCSHHVVNILIPASEIKRVTRVHILLK